LEYFTIFIPPFLAHSRNGSSYRTFRKYQTRNMSSFGNADSPSPYFEIFRKKPSAGGLQLYSSVLSILITCKRIKRSFRKINNQNNKNLTEPSNAFIVSFWIRRRILSEHKTKTSGEISVTLLLLITATAERTYSHVYQNVREANNETCSELFYQSTEMTTVDSADVSTFVIENERVSFFVADCSAFGLNTKRFGSNIEPREMKFVPDTLMTRRNVISNAQINYLTNRLSRLTDF